jgi:glycosyltransferase involved in cell wall biosynthesis
MEAMAMRLPIVSTRITGVPELIDDGQTGLLVTPGRADLIADAIEQLLIDPSLCRAMGANAREKVIHEFNTERSAEQLHDLLARELSPTTSRAKITQEVMC